MSAAKEGAKSPRKGSGDIQKLAKPSGFVQDTASPAGVAELASKLGLNPDTVVVKVLSRQDYQVRHQKRLAMIRRMFKQKKEKGRPTFSVPEEMLEEYVLVDAHKLIASLEPERIALSKASNYSEDEFPFGTPEEYIAAKGRLKNVKMSVLASKTSTSKSIKNAAKQFEKLSAEFSRLTAAGVGDD